MLLTLPGFVGKLFLRAVRGKPLGAYAHKILSVFEAVAYTLCITFEVLALATIHGG